MNKEILIQCITEETEIYNLLIQFDSVFPHLHEKIDSYKEYAHKLRRYAEVYVCREASENIGILVLYANDFSNRIAYIALIGVMAKWEGKGIGKCLLEHAVLTSKEKGMEELKLEVDLDNKRAINFYKTNDFVNCNDEDGFSMHMLKRLGEV